MIEAIRELTAAQFGEWQRIRRHIHAHPELSFEEHDTAAFISAQLTAWGIPHQTGIAGTGISGVLEGKSTAGKCIAIRAELDALPILEANQSPYTSRNEGVMHACGHDVHATCLLGVLRILQELKAEWVGQIKFIFQPGEEKHPGGGSLMIAAGILENPKVDAVLGLHVYPTLPAGFVGFRSGQYMAATDEIHIEIKGKGGHAALPHLTIDPITISAQVITALQQVISRRGNPVSPSVLSFGYIAGGAVNNVIPDTVKLAGTLRTMNEAWRNEAHQLIRDIVHNTCSAFGATATIDIPKGYPSLYNDLVLTMQAEQLAKAYLGETKVKTLDLRMTADDFAFYAHEVPGCFFRIGTNRNNEEFTASVHNPHFDIDEQAMITAIGTMAWIAANAAKG
jgi:hippurate hydrolase